VTSGVVERIELLSRIVVKRSVVDVLRISLVVELKTVVELTSLVVEETSVVVSSQMHGSEEPAVCVTWLLASCLTWVVETSFVELDSSVDPVNHDQNVVVLDSSASVELGACDVCCGEVTFGVVPLGHTQGVVSVGLLEVEVFWVGTVGGVVPDDGFPVDLEVTGLLKWDFIC
jgi:hypothetical protein